MLIKKSYNAATVKITKSNKMYNCNKCFKSFRYRIHSGLQNDDTILKALNGNYTITTINNEDVSSINLNISFNDSTKQVSGFSGCNRFFRVYTIDNNTLNFTDLGTTRMFCSEEKNNLENNLLTAYGKANVIFFTKNGFSIYKKKKLLLTASKDIEEVLILNIKLLQEARTNK